MMAAEAPGELRSELGVPADHPAFSGHFPGLPVLPGAVLLDEALRAIVAARHMNLQDWQIATVKFLEIARPGDPLAVHHAIAVAGQIRFVVRSAGRTLVTGSLTHAA
ncbi:MAG: hypothetical protein NVSMB10_03380 [Steroidobacteraceae bacterium]